MAIEKRGRKYYIKGKIKKDDGTFYQYTKLAEGCKGLKEAKEYERVFRKNYQSIQISLGYKTFEELCKEYLKNDTSVKKASLRTYQDVLNKACEYLGKKHLNLISKDILQKYIKDLEKDYSEAYVQKIYYIMSKMFNYAVDKDYIQNNPISKVRLSPNKDTVKKEMQFWEPNQFETFLRYIDDDLYYTFFIFLYYMGVRKGEAMALSWKDIDFNSCIVKINKTVTNKIKGEKSWTITTPKTSNSTRNITMPDVVKKTLSEWQEIQKKTYKYSDDCFVFGNYRPLPFENIRRNLKKYIDKANKDNANLPIIRVHDLRHSHASYLINAKTDMYTDYDIAKRLGDTVETLHNTYAHWFKSADKGIIEMMNNTKTTDNKYSELKELKELLDMKIITQEDFDLKKKEILNL